MSNVIFLDIDGVLLPFGSYNWALEKVFANPYNYLDRLAARSKHVENVRALCQEKNAKLVLISTWRYLFPEQFLQDYMTRLGLWDLFHRDWIAVNPNKNYSGKNPDIQLWLRRNPDTATWWIIDDEDHDIPAERWIKTDPYVGYAAAA